MTQNTGQDLVVDCAELSCNLSVLDNDHPQTYEVVAYPTQQTRKLTNSLIPGTSSNQEQTGKQCRWLTPGIIRFYVNPTTKKLYQLELNELIITLECFLNYEHKQELAKRAEELYGVSVTAQNFATCTFKTFIGKLRASINGINKEFFGKLVDNRRVHPMQLSIQISDSNDLNALIENLDKPLENIVILEYTYSLSGTTAFHSSVTISSEQVNQFELQKQIFGDSKVDYKIVSRSFMDTITSYMSNTLRIVETIGVGGAPFGQDLVKQALTEALCDGFKMLTIEDIQKLQQGDMSMISDDLKPDIIASASLNEWNLQDIHKLDQGANANQHTTNNYHRDQHASRISGNHSNAFGGTVSGKIGLFGGSASFNASSAVSHDNSNSSDHQIHHKATSQSAQSHKLVDDMKRANSTGVAFSGKKVHAKKIDCAIIYRWKIKNGFNVSLDRWIQQLSSTSITGRITTRNDIQKQISYEEQMQLVDLQKQLCQERAERQRLEIALAKIDLRIQDVESEINRANDVIRQRIEDSHDDIKDLRNTVGQLWKREETFREKDRILFVDTVLLTSNQQLQLNKFFGVYDQRWGLLYRASRDGFGQADFHRLCDDQGPTMCIMKSGSYIFGGYTSVSWKGYGNVETKADSSAFLFTLINPHGITPTKYPVSKPLTAIELWPGFGPVFGTNTGSGCDLVLVDQCNRPINYGAFPNHYTDTTGKGITTFAGAARFTCNDYEVFRKL